MEIPPQQPGVYPRRHLLLEQSSNPNSILYSIATSWCLHLIQVPPNGYVNSLIGYKSIANLFDQEDLDMHSI